MFAWMLWRRMRIKFITKSVNFVPAYRAGIFQIIFTSKRFIVYYVLLNVCASKNGNGCMYLDIVDFCCQKSRKSTNSLRYGLEELKLHLDAEGH